MRRSIVRAGNLTIAGLAAAALFVLVFVQWCFWFETPQSRITEPAAWPNAPAFMPASTSEVRLAQNIDIYCVRWLRFRVAPNDTSRFADLGSPMAEDSAQDLSLAAPWWLTWWRLPQNSSWRVYALDDAPAWKGHLVVVPDQGEAYFRGCGR